MHVHQPVDLVLGLFMFPLGLVGLGRDLYRVFIGAFKNRYEDWRSLSLSIWFLSGGPAHFSNAFDLRHHESHTTSVLDAVEVSCLSIILLASSAAWVVRRRRHMGAPVAETAHPAT